jgi:hypothetical protein
MTKLLDDLLYFWGWKWAKKRSEPQSTYETALVQSMDILKSKYWCPDDLFESLAVMDKMDIILIDTSAEAGIPRYRIYGRNGCQHFCTMDQVSAVMSAKINYGYLHGVAFGKGHFCPLYPLNMQPNFAGKHALGQHE